MKFNKIISTLLLGMSFVNCLPCFSFSNLDATSKWIVKIETKEINNQFNYAGSGLRNLIKAKVSYYRPNESSKACTFEDFWLRDDGKPIGLKRHRELSIPANDDVAIRLSFASNSDGNEQEAAADVVLRLLLELYKNGNIVTRIIVPSGTMQQVASGIERHNFSSTRPQTTSPLAVFLQTEDGSSTTLYYTR